MKLEIYKVKDFSFSEIEEYLEEFKFKHKEEDEIKNLILRTGFTSNADGDYGTNDCISFRFRVDKRKIPTSVRKRYLKHPDMLAKKREMNKKQWKRFQQEALEMLELRMPWGTKECNIVIKNNYMFIIDGINGVSTHLSKFIEHKLIFDLKSLSSGLEDSHKGLIIEPAKGTHSYRKGEEEFTVKGNISEADDYSKITIVSTMVSSICATVKRDTVSVTSKAFFNEVQDGGHVSKNDLLADAIDRFIELIVDPLSENFGVQL